MSFLMPKSSPPKPAPPPPIVTRASPELEDQRERDRVASLRGRGRQSTILTSPLGATDTPRVARAAALGDVA